MTTDTTRIPRITTNWPLVRGGAAIFLGAAMLWTLRCSGWSLLTGLDLLMVATGCQMVYGGLRKLLSPDEMSIEARQFEADYVLVAATYTVIVALLVFATVYRR